MIRYIAWRLLQTVPVLFGVTLFVFVLLRLIPGDPIAVMLPADSSPEVIAVMREKLGLDQPIYIQYFLFLRDAITGDFGTSYVYKQPAMDLIITRVGFSLILTAYAVILGLAAAFPVAVLAARQRETIWDNAVRAVVIAASAVPRYWLGIILIIIFVINLRWFPMSTTRVGFPDVIWVLFLPALTTGIALFPEVVRSLRGSLIESAQSDFVATARAKGLSEWKVYMGHAVRTALIPAVTLTGLNVSFLVGGQVVVESVFGLPGLGQLMIGAISARDFPIIQGATVMFAVLVVAINTLTDIVISVLDPRARTYS